MQYQTINPSTGEFVQSFDVMTDAVLDVELTALEDTFLKWSNTSFQYRSEIVLKLKLALENEKNRFARIMAIEMGKPLHEGVQEIEKCISLCDYYASNTEALLSSYPSAVDIEPLGIIVGIMPWNFPFWQVFRFLIPSLMIGNVVLIKPSQNIPQCALAIAELFHTIDCEDKIYSNAFLLDDQVTSVIQDPRVKGVSFTGSPSVGRIIATTAAKVLKPCVLELGGSDPMIVCEDVDWGILSDAIVRARCHNAGQTCIAAKRFFVHKDVFDQFLMTLTSRLDTLSIGDSLDPTTTMGPLAREDLKLTLSMQVDQSLSEGAKSRYSYPKKLPEKGNFYPPTVLTHLTETMPVLKEETFGPVYSLVPFGTDDEAVFLSNNSQYGLGASVWSSDSDRAETIAAKLSVGSVAINQVLSSQASRCFGGLKASGYGKELGLEGLLSFTNLKSIFKRA